MATFSAESLIVPVIQAFFTENSLLEMDFQNAHKTPNANEQSIECHSQNKNPAVDRRLGNLFFAYSRLADPKAAAVDRKNTVQLKPRNAHVFRVRFRSLKGESLCVVAWLLRRGTDVQMSRLLDEI